MKIIIFVIINIVLVSCSSTHYYPDKELPKDKVEMIKNMILYPSKLDSILNQNQIAVDRIYIRDFDVIDSSEIQKIKDLQSYYNSDSALLSEDITISRVVFSPNTNIGREGYTALEYQIGVVISNSNFCIRCSFISVSNLWYLCDIEECEVYERLANQLWREK